MQKWKKNIEENGSRREAERIRGKITEILKDVKSGIDYKNEKKLIGEQLLDSLDLVFLISALELEFDIEITAQYCDSRYFESVDTIMQLLEEL